jgi:hypothetical protein
MPTGYLWAKTSTLLSEAFRNLPEVNMLVAELLSRLPLITASSVANMK